MALAITAAICAQAYVHSGRGPNTPYFVDDPSHVKFFVNSQTQAGLENLNGDTVIATDSSPTAAILGALDRWNAVSDSTLHFDSPASVATASGLTDGQSVITFADTASNRSITGGAVAVTRLISDSTGELTDTDIIFNPLFEFSTTLQPDTFDIEGTLVHELGHAIGMGHAGSTSSTMFATTARGSADLRTLTDDDTSYARAVYPSTGIPKYGSLAIDVEFSNKQPARGALVTAIDRSRNVLLTGLSDSSGRATIGSVPSGSYVLYAEPANEPALPSQFSQFGVLDSIATTVAGGPDFPTVFNVPAFGETTATLTLKSSSDTLNIVGAGGALEGGSVESDYGFVARPSGQYIFEIYGDGLDDPSISLPAISFLGTGVTVEGPLEQDEVELFGGRIYPLLRFHITVSPTAPIGSLSARLRLGDQLSLFTGALEITDPTPVPSFSSNGVVNAASFEAVSLSPGGIFSIFGDELAPAEGFAFFDPLSGGLIEILRGVSVLVDDRPAPLFYVSPEQINAQAPIDLQPGSFVTVRVLRDDVTSSSRILPVAAAAPGVFVHSESNRAVALNQDGSLNSPASPADRDTIVTIYLTGAGAVAPVVATGRPARLPPPLSPVVEGVTATINGQLTIVEFAGAAPGFVGLIQVNVRIPPTSPTGDAVALRVLAGGVASQPGTTISIR
ncbi:MAG: matrixin family metalloprotease [Acidobacteria bacterium]|nr:matrixin family metalloprotease [Acidobacteriota bacterium]MDA1235899.1 matrixin family metalloprotease [Acidobacteriota bacterium]